MSVVAVRVTDKGYTVAADSIGVLGYTQTKGENVNMVKLKEVNGIVIGGVGYAEETNLLCLFCETRKPETDTQSSLLTFLSEFSDWKFKKTGKYYGGNHYIIVLGDKVYSVMGYEIDQVTSYWAIGAGMDFALASLHLGHTPEEAVSTAIELSVYCENPIRVIKKEFI